MVKKNPETQKKGDSNNMTIPSRHLTYIQPMLTLDGYKCPRCKQKPIKKEYFFAMHMGFKHNEWYYMQNWCANKGGVWIGGRKCLIPPEEEPNYGNDIFLERKWKCAVCDNPVIYNSTKHYIVCRCGKIEDYEIPQKVLSWAYRITTLRG